MVTLKKLSDQLLNDGELTHQEYEMLKESELFETEISKFAAAPLSAGMNALKALKDYGPLVGVGAVGSALFKESIINPIIKNIKINRSFRQLRDKTPALASKTDDEMRDYFKVIKTFSPKAASNPLVAGALVNKMMEFGGVDHKLVQDIASIEGDAGVHPVLDQFLSGASGAISGIKAGDDLTFPVDPNIQP